MKPLQGIRVVDFTEGAQGPFAASMLADFGAEVVKVERPGGEMMRRLGPYHDGLALPVLTIAHGRSAVIELDMKEPRQHREAIRLVSAADIVMQNWKVGTDARLGLDFEHVSRLNPQIVYVRSTGYGTEGPFATMGSMDPLSQAISGMSSVSGDPDTAGERVRTPILDFVSAFVTAEAALVGVAERRRTGRAVLVDASQLSAALDALGPEVSLSNLGPVAPAGRTTRLTPLGGFFRCRDGVFVAIECRDESEVALLQDAFELGPNYPPEGALEAALSAMDAAEALTRCRQASIPAAAVERSFDASLFERFPGAVRTVSDRLAGEIRQSEAPWILSATPVETGRPLGPVGQDNNAVEDLIARWEENARSGVVSNRTRSCEPEPLSRRM